jgi:ribosomal protein S17E
LNYNLNLYIQKDEIIKCIQKLKNNKAGGEDAIINEYIKKTSNQFIEIYEKLFNLIFDTGFIPESWVVLPETTLIFMHNKEIVRIFTQSLTQNSCKKFTQTAN